MKKFVFIVLFIFIESDFVSAQAGTESPLSSIRLTTLDGKLFSGEDVKKNTASAFIFLLPDCPACENYSLTLNQLNQKFKSSGINFYGVFPGLYNTLDEMKSYQSRYHINFMLMIDPEKKLVRNLRARIAPEVIVVNTAGQTIYRGRIDNWMYAAGKKRTVITTHELQDALEAVVQKQPLKVKETAAVGCIIE